MRTGFSHVFVALFLFSAAAPYCWATDNEAKLTLEGEVVQSTLERVGREQIYQLRVKLRFTNNGERSIILLRGTYRGERAWWVLDTPLYSSLQDSREGRFFSVRPTRPANSRSFRSWQNIRKALQAKAPPNEWTYTIGPRSTFVTEIETFIIVRDWDNVAPKSRIWLKLALEMWPDNLEVSEAAAADRTLGLTLQKRWRSVGDLWLDDILSEPILFDLP